jgi:hypothetical protein
MKLQIYTKLEQSRKKRRSKLIRDFPKWLNTKQDYLNCLKDFPEKTKTTLQELLTDRFSWFPVRELTEGEAVAESNTYKVVESKDEETQETKRVLYELKEDEHARLFLLGFTVEEVNGLINKGA